MSTTGVPFEKRLRNIVRTHQRINQGAVHSMRSDGLIVARPRLYNPRFPLKGLLLIIVALILFKAYILADLGQATYQERVGALAEGNVFEKVGAWVMQPDAVTTEISAIFSGLGL